MTVARFATSKRRAPPLLAGQITVGPLAGDRASPKSRATILGGPRSRGLPHTRPATLLRVTNRTYHAYRARSRPGLLLSFSRAVQPVRLRRTGFLWSGRQSMEKERARLELQLQQAQRLETLGTFTSGVAHNFNNILGGILGHSEEIKERLRPDGHVLQNLAAIRRGAKRARDLVVQILAFARRRDEHRQPLSVRALFEESSLLDVSLPLGIDLSIRASAAAVVAGEPAQLQQVIFILCNNAARAMENAGRIQVEAEFHDVAGTRSLSHGELQAGRYVSIVVKNTGRGLEGVTLARIFEPFFTTRSAGNGLGLSTGREHGGVIDVKSVLDEGSRFVVRLPCVLAGRTQTEIDAVSLPLGRGETVLIVAEHGGRLLDDEETLAAIGYEPVGFAEADAALAACGAKPERFDVIIVGPCGTTASSLELVAALHTVTPNLPIVLATRSTGEIGADSLLGAGIADVVHWPYRGSRNRRSSPPMLGTGERSDVHRHWC